jgi:N-methylhydantoinase A
MQSEELLLRRRLAKKSGREEARRAAKRITQLFNLSANNDSMLNIVGIDIGGTFTDFVVYLKQSGKIELWKEPTTQEDPIQAVIAGLKRVHIMSPGGKIRLGTTIATNALLTRQGAKVGYVTTRGFRDIPFIQRGDRRSHYDISWIKAKPFVERRYCYEVNERLSAKGEVVLPLDEAEVRELARTLKAQSIEAVAICFLFSYMNPQHELRTREIIAEEFPGIPVSISYEVLAKWKEYERASTTIADAFLKPVITHHFKNVQNRLGAAGIGASISIIKSNGGEGTLENAAATPVQLTLSGPTGAVVATRALARLTGIENLVTFDMGGTSTDCSTVVNGMEHITTDFEIEWGIPIQIPMIDIRTIGAGGGSIAWIDKGGMLRVGPQSAGSEPGPACYGRGGVEPTVTDANVVAGRINPHYFLGGRMPLNPDAAFAAIAQIAKTLEMSIDDTAMAIIQIANNNMLGALRAVLLQRGFDPRDFTLVAAGGAGPVHTCDLMRLAAIPCSFVPNSPAQFSAFGFIVTDARVDKHRTAPQTSRLFKAEQATRVMKELTSSAIAELEDQGYTQNIEIYRSIEARYLGQNHELEVAFPAEDFTEDSVNDLWRRFHDEHNARFGFCIPGETIETVTLKAVAVSLLKKPEISVLPVQVGIPESEGKRRVLFEEGWLEAPIYNRQTFGQGCRITGPAVIEEEASATVVCPGQRLAVDPFGHLMISV